MDQGRRAGDPAARLLHHNVKGGLWMPAGVEVRVAAKTFFVKSLEFARVLTYSEYRLAEPRVLNRTSLVL